MAQGLVSGHHIFIGAAEEKSMEILNGCMGLSDLNKKNNGLYDDDDNEEGMDFGGKMSIAWRYEKLGKFDARPNGSTPRTQGNIM